MEKEEFDNEKNILQIINDEMNMQEKTHDELAAAFGRERSTASKFLSGHNSSLKLEHVHAAARLLGLDPGMLAMGKKRYSNDESPPTLSSFGRSGISEHGIPEIDVSAGAGEGTLGDIVTYTLGKNETYAGHPVVGEWHIPDGFTENALGIRVSKSVIMRVVGDSMDPTYRHGDRVVVDLRQDEFISDGVYLISDGDSAPQIKRLQLVMFTRPREVIIVSDNSSHVDQRVILDHVKIIGRVAGRFTAT